MSIFSKHWWHHHIKKWKAVGDIFGITGKLDKTEKEVGNKAKTIAENANKDEAGDQRYEGGYEKSNTGESISDAVGQSIAHSEGDDE